MGRMVLVLVLALVTAQFVAFFIFAHDREDLLVLANRDKVLDRSVSLARIMAITPEERWEDVLAAARMRGFEAHIGASPSVERERERNSISRDVARRLGDGVAGPVLSDIDDELHEQYRRHGPAATVSLEMSVGLGPGRWLNMEHKLRPPAFWRIGPLLYVLLTALAVCLAGALMVRRITRPIAALADASDRFGRGEDVEPLPEGGAVELARAASAFNRMRERIMRFVADRTRMLAALGHDLRTPITSLRLRTELMADGEDKEKFLDTLAEMEAMTESTLAFVREEGQAEPMRRSDLGSLVESVVDDLRDLGHDIEFTPGERSVLSCRPVALKRAASNLVLNACRYGERAEVLLTRSKGAAVVMIDDHGPGIPEADLERVFEPFVRLEESRSRETGGYGLGLAIARTILRGHGGEVTLENREGRGLRAIMTLPLE